MVDKANKPFSKTKKIDDFKNMHCIWHPHGNHMTGDSRIFIDRYTRKKGDNKEVDQKKEEEDQDDKGFQKSKGIVGVIVDVDNVNFY